MLDLNEDQIDLLKEIFNVGMGKTLKVLAELAGKEHEVIFSLPKLEVIRLADLIKRVGGDDNNVSIIQQSYNGVINGKALMLYPDKSSLELANLIMGTSLPIDEISKLENDALAEIGNMLINASLSSFANFVDKEIKTDLPKVKAGAPEVIFPKEIINDQIIYLDATFTISNKELVGHLALLIDDDCYEQFLKVIDEYNAQFEI